MVVSRAVRLRRAIARARTRLNYWRRAIYRSPEIQVYKIKFYSYISAFQLICAYLKIGDEYESLEQFKVYFHEQWRTNFQPMFLIARKLKTDLSHISSLSRNIYTSGVTSATADLLLNLLASEGRG